MSLNILNLFANYDNNSKFLITVIAIISVLLILIFIFNYLSNRQIRRQKKLGRLISKEAKNITPEKKDFKVPVKVVEEKVIVNEPISINKNISTINNEPLIKEEEEIIEVLQDENESDIDRILREIKESTIEESFNLTEFEREQEESAIISYDELCKRAGVKKKVYKTTKETEEIHENNSVNKKYKPTEFVSPIYGVQNKKSENISYDENDLDQTFLQSLKEFKSTLE
ncbi:MAG: hypothetical protein IIZ40_01840 [Bacilli bacterium]|nr:hypothetical protein [Bacilli bacterium]